jgi:DNA-binding MarR family transcriptional regulator
MFSAVASIRRIVRVLRLASQKTQAAAGISAAQLFVLRSLEDGDDASLSEIAARTLTDRSSVAAVVDRLVDAGLVSRAAAVADRRRAAIAITRAGRSVLKRAPEPPTALLVAGLDALTDRQLASLARGLALLTHAMGLGEAPAGMFFDDSAGGS